MLNHGGLEWAGWEKPSPWGIGMQPPRWRFLTNGPINIFGLRRLNRVLFAVRPSYSS